jgi:hypothetical protein
MRNLFRATAAHIMSGLALRPLRFSPIAFLVLAQVPVLAASLPNMVCKEGKVVHVTPGILQVREYTSSTVYRVQDGKLYLKNGTDQEYLYGTVKEVDLNRFVSGHKTIYYLQTPQSAQLVAHFTHVYSDEVRISVAACILS